MKRSGYPCGITFDELFSNFKSTKEDRELIIKTLIDEGYSEKGICYGAGRSEEKIAKYVGDPRFCNIFINEVRKNSLKIGDKRWENKMKSVRKYDE